MSKKTKTNIEKDYSKHKKKMPFIFLIFILGYFDLKSYIIIYFVNFLIP